MSRRQNQITLAAREHAKQYFGYDYVLLESHAYITIRKIFTNNNGLMNFAKDIGICKHHIVDLEAGCSDASLLYKIKLCHELSLNMLELDTLVYQIISLFRSYPEHELEEIVDVIRRGAKDSTLVQQFRSKCQEIYKEIYDSTS